MLDDEGGGRVAREVLSGARVALGGGERLEGRVEEVEVAGPNRVEAGVRDPMGGALEDGLVPNEVTTSGVDLNAIYPTIQKAVAQGLAFLFDRRPPRPSPATLVNPSEFGGGFEGLCSRLVLRIEGKIFTGNRGKAASSLRSERDPES